jgi:TldD protein
MNIRDAAVLAAETQAGMPSDLEMQRAVKEVAANVSALSQAPVGENYSGPVLFESLAAAQLFAELLPSNLTPARRPVPEPGRPANVLASEWEGRVGARVLPDWMDIADDSTQTEWRGRPLFGHYPVDLEGVAPRPVSIVEKGILKNYLLTRQPVVGSEGSTGHARLPGSFGAHTARPGNLFVRARETTSEADLRKKLIDMCRQRNKPYGLIVKKLDFPSSASMQDLRSLFSGMMRSGSGARPVSPPILIYRVSLDGKEELVRGLYFRGVTTRSLKDIIAAGDRDTVLNYLENGAPFAVIGGANFVTNASVIAPAILFEDMELEHPRDELPSSPLVPPPALRSAAAR